MDDLSRWIGSRDEIDDVITAWPVRALQATLDLADNPLGDGDPLPPLWHWLFFLSTTKHSGLGPEGHATLGGFLPPVALPRRMFAGGRFTFHRPLRIGDTARRVATVVSIDEKQGKSGALVFVVVRHEISDEGGLCIVEEQDLVYREAASGSQEPSPGDEPIPKASWVRTVTPDAVMLFRFSALTFNSHRIHYDHPYVTAVEGYPGLVVHGPMTALLLADHAQRNGGRRLASFSFRGHSPLFAGNPFTLVGNPVDVSGAELSVWSDDRRLAVSARATYSP